MIALTLHGTRRTLPTTWEDAGPAAWQMLRALARMPEGEGKLEATRLLLGLSRRKFRQLAEDDVLLLSAGLDWLTPGPLTAALRARFWAGGRCYGWVGEDFDDGTCLQYALADEYFTAAMTQEGTAATTASHRLIATLAPPVIRWPGRTESRDRIEARAHRLRKLPPEYALQALMYWAGIRGGMDRRYGEYLFRGFAFDRGGAKVPSFGWWSAFQDVAEGRVFGNLNDVYLANFHEVAQWMLRKEAARRAQVMEMERLKNKS